MIHFGRCLRPALAPLRDLARFAVFGLAAIAIAGCDASVPGLRECKLNSGAVFRYMQDGADGLPENFNIGAVRDLDGWSHPNRTIASCRDVGPRK